MPVVIYHGPWPLPALDPGPPIAIAPPTAARETQATAVELELGPVPIARLQSHGAHVLTLPAWERERRNSVLACGKPWVDPPEPEPEPKHKAQPKAQPKA